MQLSHDDRNGTQAGNVSTATSEVTWPEIAQQVSTRTLWSREMQKGDSHRSELSQVSSCIGTSHRRQSPMEGPAGPWMQRFIGDESSG